MSFCGSVNRPTPSHPTTPHTATWTWLIRRLQRVPVLHRCVDAILHCKHLAAGLLTPAGRDDAAWPRSSASTVSARVATAVYQPRASIAQGKEKEEEEEGTDKTRTGKAEVPWS